MNYGWLGVIGICVLLLAAGSWLFRASRAPEPVRHPTRTQPAGPPPELVVSTLAGRPLPPNYADGQGTAARFYQVGSLAADAQGNLYLIDGPAIRKITPAGRVTTLAGEPPAPQKQADGYVIHLATSTDLTNGRGVAARFTFPQAIAVAADGTVYVAENHAIRRISPQGDVTTLAGKSGFDYDAEGHRDGPAAQARFRRPMGLVLDAAGNLYVADTQNSVIRRITPAGIVSTLAGEPGEYGAVDGAGRIARFAHPQALSLAPDGALLVADVVNGCIRRVSMRGEVTTWAGTMTNTRRGTWPGAKLRLDGIQGMVVDKQGTIYLTSHDSRHTVRRILPDHTEPVSPWAGVKDARAYADSPNPAQARFNYPDALALGPDGTLYVADVQNKVLRAITPAGQVTTLAGEPPRTSLDGPAVMASFSQPRGLALEPDGNLLVADFGNGLVRRVSPQGEVRTIAGRFPHPEERSQAPEEIFNPAGVVAGPVGSIFIADEGRHTIYRLSAEGKVQVWAGQPGIVAGNHDDGLFWSARFNKPGTLAAAPDGTLYVTDGETMAVRRISPKGKVSTLLKGDTHFVSPFSNEGHYFYPSAVAVGPDGAVYVLQGRLLRYAPGSSRSEWLAGDYEPGYADGAGRQARFHYPTGLAVDVHGNVFIADRGNHLIRRVSPQGEVTTVAGQTGRHRMEPPLTKYAEHFYGPDDSGGMEGQALGDYRDGPAAQARFNHPAAVAVAPDGTLYVADQDNN
ncbi:hypothetical protein LRS06_02250 [Hymenobacter sp. J193]|uniref:hypothetical protein n=1 Tax=Hymenobacter sp. J193 TaxID=2898429 RepID=UPI00215184FC|nr:hypothetical protein [Hymenobacter sp. J193]MCR5886613.1 hypothetical protein [Hymenobacter sp. J193]